MRKTEIQRLKKRDHIFTSNTRRGWKPPISSLALRKTYKGPFIGYWSVKENEDTLLLCSLRDIIPLDQIDQMPRFDQEYYESPSRFSLAKKKRATVTLDATQGTVAEYKNGLLIKCRTPTSTGNTRTSSRTKMREAAFRSITGTDRNENRKNSARRLTGSGWVQAARAERKYESAGLARDKCGLLEHNGYQHTENSLNLMNGCNPADLSARLDFARQKETPHEQQLMRQTNNLVTAVDESNIERLLIHNVDLPGVTDLLTNITCSIILDEIYSKYYKSSKVDEDTFNEIRDYMTLNYSKYITEETTLQNLQILRKFRNWDNILLIAVRSMSIEQENISKYCNILEKHPSRLHCEISQISWDTLNLSSALARLSTEVPLSITNSKQNVTGCIIEEVPKLLKQRRKCIPNAQSVVNIILNGFLSRAIIIDTLASAREDSLYLCAETLRDNLFPNLLDNVFRLTPKWKTAQDIMARSFVPQLADSEKLARELPLYPGYQADVRSVRGFLDGPILKAIPPVPTGFGFIFCTNVFGSSHARCSQTRDERVSESYQNQIARFCVTDAKREALALSASMPNVSYLSKQALPDKHALAEEMPDTKLDTQFCREDIGKPKADRTVRAVASGPFSETNRTGVHKLCSFFK
ncbi:hypothetical protein WN51_03306 [Melipona quadrifasciata]|uniref:Uncharacterized protein n=1 Tax=Melipona quadrifasciata TaxID=166423 RepID=A0A0N1ITB6_9HYME|nr:hypothetical protein WN51_03306 [Melipona quadrifasciata]